MYKCAESGSAQEANLYYEAHKNRIQKAHYDGRNCAGIDSCVRKCGVLHILVEARGSQKRGYYNGCGTCTVAVAAFVAVSVLALKYEQKIYEQDKVLSEFLDIFSSFVDAKDSYMYGHS